MKYKVGDKGKIRKDLKVGGIYGGCRFASLMQNVAGKIARIKGVSKRAGCYRIDLNQFLWTDEMFEDDIDMEVQEMNKRVVIDTHENYVVARCGDKEGFARCHPDDDFDFFVGAKIALERLEKAEKPYAWLKAGTIYYIPDISYKQLYYEHTYEADSWDKRVMERGIVFQTKEEAIACAKKMLAVVKRGDCCIIYESLKKRRADNDR